MAPALPQCGSGHHARPAGRASAGHHPAHERPRTPLRLPRAGLHLEAGSCVGQPPVHRPAELVCLPQSTARKRDRHPVGARRPLPRWKTKSVDHQSM